MEWIKGIAMIRLSYLTLASVILTGCGTVETSLVEEGTPNDDISSIIEVKRSESTSGTVSSDISRVDGKLPAHWSSFIAGMENDFRSQYKIFISPGIHSVTVSCSRGWLGFRKLFTFSFNAVESRDYAAKCEFVDYGGMFSCKADWWVEIVELDSNEVVMKTEVTRHDEC